MNTSPAFGHAPAHALGFRRSAGIGLFLWALLWLGPSLVFAAAPELRLETQTPLLKVGDSFLVNLTAQGVEGLFGASWKVTFDETELELVETHAGELFFFGAALPPFVRVRESLNTVALTISRNVGDLPISRDGTLAELIFRTRKTGIATIQIDPATVTLVTKDGTPIPGMDGLVIVPLRVSTGEGLILNPEQGAVGSEVFASAAGFLPGEAVRLLLDDDPVGPPVQADVDGAILNARLEVPRIPGGTHQVAVEGTETGRRFETPLDVLPSIRNVLPAISFGGGQVEVIQGARIAPGALARITADGFAAGEQLRFLVGDAPVGAVLQGETTDETGRTVAVVQLPTDLVGGPVSVSAEGRTSRTRATFGALRFVVPRILSVSPSSGGLGTRIQISASGFTPGEVVNVTYNGIPVPEAGGVTVNTRGSVRTSLTVTAELVPRSEYGAATIGLSTSTDAAAGAPFFYTPIPQITEFLPESGGTSVGPQESVEVRGVGFVAGATLSATFGDVPIDLNGATADESGAIDARFEVPTLPAGSYDLVVRGGGAEARMPNVRVTGRITRVAWEGSSTPEIGAFGTVLVVEGAGFEADAEVSFDLGRMRQVATTRTDANGLFRAGIILEQLPDDLPTGTGETTLVARDRRNSAEATVFISSPSASMLDTAQIRVSPSEATVGEMIHVTGTGFAENVNVGSLLLDSESDLRSTPQVLPITQVLAGRNIQTGAQPGLQTDANGVFEVLVVLPSLPGPDGRAGAKEIMTSFPVDPTTLRPAIAATLTVRPSLSARNPSGTLVQDVTPGDSIVLQGAGFAPFETILASVGAAPETPVQQTDGSGQLVAAQFVVPNVPAGTQMLRVRGQLSNVVAQVEITVRPTFEILSPAPETLVSTGTLVQVRGAGFPEGDIAFDVAGVPLTPNAVPISSNGSFTTTFSDFSGPLPARGAIRATVGTVEVTTPQFLRFLTTTFRITPTEGPAGTTVRVTGAPGNRVQFGSRLLGVLRNGTVVSTRWEGQFTVPAVAGGTYEVRVGTIPQGTEVPTFTVTPTLHLSPAQARIGDIVTVEGTGFRANIKKTIVTIGNATTPVAVATDGTGSFVADIRVPETAGGRTRVSVTDQRFVRSAPIDIQPVLTGVEPDPNVVVEGQVPIGGDLRIRGAGFGPEEEVEVFVGPSAVSTRQRLRTTLQGSVDITVPVPPVPGGRHDVRVVGKVSGLSASLEQVVSVLPVLNPPRPTSGAAGTDVVVSGAGFEASETVRVSLGESLLGEASARADGTFELDTTITQALPNDTYDLTAVGVDSGLAAQLPKAFVYRDTRPPTLLGVELTASADPLRTGDTITITAIQAEDFDVIQEATYRLGTLSGSLSDEDGDRKWTAVIPVEAGLRLANVSAEATLVDLAGNRARRTSTTRISVDTVVDAGNVQVAGSPAKADETLTVTMDGEAGGTATFTIPGVVQDQEMTESGSGTYTGRYTVKEGDAAQDVPVSVTFTDATGNTITVESDSLVTVDSVAHITKVEVLGSPAQKDDTLTFVVTAEPGGSAIVTVPGLFEGLPLEEKSDAPGVYQAVHRVERKQPLEDAIVQVSFADALGNATTDDSARLTILAAPEVTIRLAKGLNLISIPVNDPTIRTVRDLLDRIGPDASFVLWQGPGTGRLISYSREMSPSGPNNGIVRGGAGYIVTMKRPGELTVTGTPWLQTSVELRAGLNMIGLTRVDPSLTRLSDFETRIGSAFQQAIVLDAALGRFVSFLPSFDPSSAVNRRVEIGQGILLLVRFPKTLTFSGPPPIAVR